MKKIDYRKSIVVGFLAVYVMGMFFSTNMVMESYEKRHTSAAENIKQELKILLENAGDTLEDSHLASYLLSYGITSDQELKYNQFSAALYNKMTGEKIAQSSVLMSDGGYYHVPKEGMDYRVYAMGELMTEEEIEHLVQIEVETLEAKENGDYPLYYYNFFANKETNEPMAFEILKQNWDKSADGGIYDPITSKWVDFDLEWRWYHPDTEFEVYEVPSTYDASIVEKIHRPNEEYDAYAVRVYSTDMFGYYDLGILVPYLENGYESWQRWQRDSHLQNYPDELPEEKETTEEHSLFTSLKIEREYEINDDYVLVIRQTSNPWLAAADYMKYVYLGGFVVVLACMLKILYTTEKTYKQRAKLEETRRDFTNAVAHELKTPLGVIRGFAENLQENINEEKREYYLEQIVGQTERMDEMVKEMIYISKLDSDKLVLNKTEVSLRKLIEESIESLSINIEEKQLNVCYKGLADRAVEGDSQYLKKAVWNIISNAVEYNRTGGRIEIVFEESACRIRNTGKHILEEDIPHVFDMFYTSNKSRTSGEKHLGLGLYLAKKICDLHELHISIANIEDGVEITIKQ